MKHDRLARHSLRRRMTALCCVGLFTTQALMGCAGGGIGVGGGGDLTIYTWADYFPLDMLERLEEETGIEATVEFFGSNDDLLAKMEETGARGYDLVVPSDYAVEIMIENGWAQRIDAMELPNASNIMESGLHPYYDPEREYSAPFMYGTSGFAYDAALLAADQERPRSWFDFFTWGQPYAGKIGILDDEFDGVNAALRAIGAAQCTAEPAHYDAALALLLDFKGRTNSISSDGTPARLGSGENSMAMIWNGDTHRAWSVNQAITYVYPTEGVSVFEDNWVVPSGSENLQEAKTFINWMLDPKNAAEAANYVGFNAHIKGVFDNLDPSMRSDPAIVPPAGAKLELIKVCDAQTMEQYSQVWSTFVG
ncbi:MAG: extracellular solute-binding protein [Bifidobacteriaceae bacterium]|jgi:spermidine/putrescine transport system substrate-binding protein|nr:extracellular solute-binding protein [Bifidobacteriaceae bacterium]